MAELFDTKARELDPLKQLFRYPAKTYLRHAFERGLGKSLSLRNLHSQRTI